MAAFFSQNSDGRLTTTGRLSILLIEDRNATPRDKTMTFYIASRLLSAALYIFGGFAAHAGCWSLGIVAWSAATSLTLFVAAPADDE
jgi:hypothetical protein